MGSSSGPPRRLAVSSVEVGLVVDAEAVDVDSVKVAAVEVAEAAAQ